MMNHLSKTDQYTSLLIDAFIKYPGKISFTFFLFDFVFMCEADFLQLAQSYHSNSVIRSFFLKIATHSNTNFRNIMDHKH